MALPEFEQRETLEALDTIAKPAGLHIGSRTVALERLGGLTNRNYKVTLGPTEQSVEVEVYVLRVPSASTAEYIDRTWSNTTQLTLRRKASHHATLASTLERASR